MVPTMYQLIHRRKSDVGNGPIDTRTEYVCVTNRAQSLKVIIIRSKDHHDSYRIVEVTA